MKKRGQITVFIILGLLIVLSVSIYTYVMHGNAKTALDSNVESVRFSAQIQPIRYFVSSCLELVTIDAIKKLGKGGGFIKPQYNSLGNPWVTEGAYFTFLYQRKSYRETSSSNPDVDLIGDGTFPNVVSGPNNWDYQLTEYITEDDSRRIRECLDEFVFF